MATTTQTLAVNAAFLQEIKEDNLELKRLLACTHELFCCPEEPPIGKFVEVLTQLRDQLAMHFSLEEAFGYFDDAIDFAPRLSETADRLRSQHRELFTFLCELVDESEQLMYHETPSPALSQIANRFADFRCRFQEHETQEDELILQSLDDDIGVGD